MTQPGFENGGNLFTRSLSGRAEMSGKDGSDNGDESFGILLWAGTKAVLKMCSQFSHRVTTFGEKSGFLTLGLRLKKKK